MLFRGSRYAGVGTWMSVDADGRVHEALRIRLIPSTPATFQRTVADGDRLDLLAFEFYGKADRFWRICDANDAMHPDELLEPGRDVKIPPDQIT
jgi:hypothetical protein